MGTIINNDIEVTRVFDFLSQAEKNIVILRGGTRSSKSYSMAQHIVINKLCKPLGRTYIVSCKTLPLLRKSALFEIENLLKKYKVPYLPNRSELYFKVLNNTCYFMGLDKPGKAASVTSDEVWMEEAVDFTLDDFTQFWLRAKHRVYLSFNPISSLHWIKTAIIDSGNYEYAEDVSTYKDNLKNLLPGQITNIESLIRSDLNYHRVYALGEWGVLKNIIYTFSTVEKPESWDDVIYGIDFGYNNPSALVKVYIKDGKAIVKELLYQSGLTNTQLISEVNKVIPVHDRNREMFADCAEPARIEEFFKAGYNIKPADKSVKDGIDFCKQNVVGLTNDSPNLIKESRTYKYKEDKDGNVQEDPLPFNNHLLDAMRYATYTYFKQAKPNIYIMGED